MKILLPHLYHCNKLECEYCGENENVIFVLRRGALGQYCSMGCQFTDTNAVKYVYGKKSKKYFSFPKDVLVAASDR